jgi:hypothetical protein
LKADLAAGWILRWQGHGGDHWSATIWDAGYEWIVAQHGGGRKPGDGKNAIKS